MNLIMDGLYNPFYHSLYFFLFMEIFTILIEWMVIKSLNDVYKYKLNNKQIIVIAVVTNIFSALFAIPVWVYVSW